MASYTQHLNVDEEVWRRVRGAAVRAGVATGELLRLLIDFAEKRHAAANVHLTLASYLAVEIALDGEELARELGEIRGDGDATWQTEVPELDSPAAAERRARREAQWRDHPTLKAINALKSELPNLSADEIDRRLDEIATAGA